MHTITTPNAAFISCSLAAGANSAGITPATDKSVQVMGCCTTSGIRAVGQVSLLHSSAVGMTWEGLESCCEVFNVGSSSIATTQIVTLDNVGNVHIEVASADTILIRNDSSTSTLASNVTLVW